MSSFSCISSRMNGVTCEEATLFEGLLLTRPDFSINKKKLKMQALSANISNILYRAENSIDHAPEGENTSSSMHFDQLLFVETKKDGAKPDLSEMEELHFSDISCGCLPEDKIPENVYHFICLENELKRRYGKRGCHGKRGCNGNLAKLRVIDFSGFKDFCNFYLDSIIDFWGLATESLQEIYVNDCFDDYRAMSMIFKKMSVSRKDLHVLSLGGNDVSCASLLDFLQESALSNRVSLQELMLDHCELREKSLFPSILSCISSNFTNVLHLRLDGCQLKNYSASICSFLSECSSLQVLDLSWNDFGGDASCEIISALHRNTKCRLQKLVFKGNFIDGSDHVFDRLGNLLLDHPSLGHLDISCSRFYGAAIDIFADSLIYSQTLETLVISRSVWCQVAISNLLCLVIKHNKSLRTLDIANGGFLTDAIDMISDAARFNTTLDNLFCDLKDTKSRQLFYGALCESKTIEDTGKSLWGIEEEEDENQNDENDDESSDLSLECSLQILYEESRLLNCRRSIGMANTLKVTRLMTLFVPHCLPFEMMEHVFNLMINDADPFSSFAISRDHDAVKSTICKWGRPSLGNIHSFTEPFSCKNLVSSCFYFLWNRQ